jgi:hypothetical protein
MRLGLQLVLVLVSTEHKALCFQCRLGYAWHPVLFHLWWL